MSDRNRPLWAWMIGIAVVMPILYALSWGPAVWMCDRWQARPLWLWQAADVVYTPLGHVINSSPEPVAKVWVWYRHLWGRPPYARPRPRVIYRSHGI